MDRISEKVIRCLLEADGYVTTATLAEMTGISVSSIKHNLNWIREELGKFDIEMQSTPKKGFCLLASEDECRKVLERLDEEVSQDNDSFIYRKGYILETLFDFKANYTIQLFSEELAVSRNTIQKDLEMIKEQLSHLNVELKKVRNQGVILQGREFNLRQAIIEHNNSRYWNWNPETILEVADGFDQRVSKKAYTYLSGTYHEIDLLKIQKLLSDAETELGITLTDIAFCRLVEYLAIMSQRILSQDIIVKTGKEELPEINIKFVECSEVIVKNLVPEQAKPLPAEALYLAACLFVNPVVGDLAKRMGNVRFTTMNMDVYRNISKDYLRSLEDVLEMKHLGQDEELITELSVFLNQIKVRERYQILVWSELHRDIQKQHSGLYAACMANLLLVEEQIEAILRQDDVAWVVLLIHNFMTDINHKMKTVFVHATDKHTALYQKRKLEKEIPQISITNMLHYKDDICRFAEDAIVITTLPKNINHKNNHKNIIRVTKHISENDIQYIKDQLEQLEERKEEGVLKDFAAQVFREDLMIRELNARTKEEVIAGMSSVLQEKGYVEEGFLSRVLERENFCPTSIGKGIAIPHHYGDMVIKSGIAIAKLKHPIVWQKVEKVSLIFLIAINFTDSEQVRMVFKYLYGLIEDAGRVQKIKESQSSEEMYHNIL